LVDGRQAGVTDPCYLIDPRGRQSFHISQLHIILDRTDALLDDFASRLRDGAYDPESSE
jgi:nuclear pore complex protein Nup107